MIKIEKNIPITSKSTIKGKRPRWGHVWEALEKMEGGDSFEIEARYMDIYGVASQMCIDVKIRKTDTPGKIRVWKV